MARFGIGQAVRRVEDARFLKGAGCFVDDMSLPGQVYGIAVYSAQAHARITLVDTSAARAAPGVVLVSLTKRFLRHVSQVFRLRDSLCHTRC